MTSQYLLDQKIRSYDQPDRRRPPKGGKDKDRQRREEQEGERTRGSEGGQESVEPERLSAAEEGPADTFVTTKLTEWQDVIREFMAGEHSPAGLVSKLLAELPALPTVLGRYCRDLKQKELEAFTKGAREAVMPKDILPISLAAVREFLNLLIQNKFVGLSLWWWCSIDCTMEVPSSQST